MGALTNVRKNLSKNPILKMFGEMRELLVFMINSEGEVDEQTVEQAIKETQKSNPNELKNLEKVEEAIKFQESRLDKEGVDRFKITDEEKDEDGYNMLPDKFKDIRETVSEKDAIKNTNSEREKGGRQRTRVDED